MNTVEGNKLIHIWMGKSFENDLKDKALLLKYHTSWDWLMPVYEKFVNLSFKQKSDRDEHQKHCRKLHNALLLPNIGFAHVFLSKGIEWYNKEQNPEASVASKAEESSQR
jgi:hypothetical protein